MTQNLLIYIVNVYTLLFLHIYHHHHHYPGLSTAGRRPPLRKGGISHTLPR